MRSIGFFDDQYPVRTVFSEKENYFRYEGWRNDDTRPAVLERYLNMPLRRVVSPRETPPSSILSTNLSTDRGGSARDSFLYKGFRVL